MSCVWLCFIKHTIKSHTCEHQAWLKYDTILGTPVSLGSMARSILRRSSADWTAAARSPSSKISGAIGWELDTKKASMRCPFLLSSSSVSVCSAASCNTDNRSDVLVMRLL